MRVKLTRKGRLLRERVSAMCQRHIEKLGQAGITEADLQLAAAFLGKLGRFWLGVSNPNVTAASATASALSPL
jgi:hypothetical protein